MMTTTASTKRTEWCTISSQVSIATSELAAVVASLHRMQSACRRKGWPV